MQIKLPESLGNLVWENSKLALEHNAIDMAIGRTEFQIPERLTELGVQYLQQGQSNYSSLEGHLPLREQVSALMQRRYGRTYNPSSEITICAGISQAAMVAISTVIGEGDEVIVFDPSYFSFNQSIKINGGMIVHVPLKSPEWTIPWEDVRKLINTKTRMIILSTPQNPTGTVRSREDMIQLQRLTAGTGIYILTDESFEFLVYDEQKHQSAALFQELAARTFIVSSPGALYSINGWGIAWCSAPEPLTKEFRKIHESSAYSVATPLQQALASYMSENQDEELVTEFYQGKRNYFNRLFKNSPYQLLPSQGSYFQLVNYRNISDENDVDFAKRLILEAGVAASPLSIFSHKRKNHFHLRLCFAKQNSTLDEVARRLIEFADKYSDGRLKNKVDGASV